MIEKKKILTISGSISRNSANLYTLKIIAELGQSSSDLNILDDLNELPHFKTELTEKNVPEKIVKFRNGIANADGIIICTLLYSPSYNNPDLVFKTEEMPGRLEFLYS